MHGGHLLSVVVFGICKGVLGHTAGRILRDQLDTLHHSIDNLVLDARVLALGVLTDRHNVDVIVQGLITAIEGFIIIL